INTLPSLLLAKHFDAAFKRSGAPLLATVSARVGSIEDNRLGGWYSYRISKAALNMALKTLSIEWRHRFPGGRVAALHPGTNDTELSKPYQANVPAENLFDPARTAASFVSLLERLEPSGSGGFRAWDGELLPW
ncbi:MAG: short chain dehydrogenase, partial [Gammaproteobacteria bacterium]